MLKICLINPRFEPSFWGYDFALPIFNQGKRYFSAPGAFPTLAALVPDGHVIELLDENVRPIDWDDLRRFDVIGMTGMIVQRERMLEILRELKKLPAIVALGGPYNTVAESVFEGLCDVSFIGEAEETWPAFIEALARGEPTLARYEQVQKTDMTKVPIGRYDLLEMGRYACATVQFSRGCPFQCEFCDIITIFGRRPRLKTPENFLAEIAALYEAGARDCFVVDDNFIGNKAAVRKMLPMLIEWQRKNGYPLKLATEASINLADDPEFIELMVQANFKQVFIGIESPRSESLNETRKFQNTRGDSMLEKVARVRDGGLVVTAGFIVGFDTDDVRIFDEQFDFIDESGIGLASVAILTPVPTTPLYDRLKAENRLDYSDPVVVFAPAQMTQKELKEGHSSLLCRLYEPAAFFGRLLRGYHGSRAFKRRQAELNLATRPLRRNDRVLRSLGATGIALRLGRELLRRSFFKRLAPAYFRAYFSDRFAFGRDSMPWHEFISLCVVHWHCFNLARLGGTKFGSTGPVVKPQIMAASRASTSPLLLEK